jgi:hypothetical protein
VGVGSAKRQAPSRAAQGVGGAVVFWRGARRERRRSRGDAAAGSGAAASAIGHPFPSLLLPPRVAGLQRSKCPVRLIAARYIACEQPGSGQLVTAVILYRPL